MFTETQVVVLSVGLTQNGAWGVEVDGLLVHVRKRGC